MTSPPPPYSATKQWSLERRFLAYLWAWRNTFIAVVTPLLLLPLLFCFENDPTLRDPMRCAYVLALMIIFWTTESLPLAITALLPMVLYPLLSLVKATDLAPQYMSESNISFVGSIIVISSFERANLHKRFALRVLTLVGAKPRWLLSGFMVVSWFLSMWISNTMTTVLLAPIVLSVTSELRNAMEVATAHQTNEHAHLDEAIEMATVVIKAKNNSDNNEKAETLSTAGEPVVQIVTPQLQKDVSHHKYENMLLLAIAYSASIGGTSTLIGTGPNLIMKSQVELAFESKGCVSPINFLSWMIFAVPMSAIFLVFLWFWLLIYFLGPMYTFGCKASTLDRHRKKIEQTIGEIYNKLPPIHFEQGVVLSHCLLMIGLLITRQLSTNPPIGWDIIAPGYVKESTATILVAIMLFIFPVTLPYINPETGKFMPPGTAISWNEAEKTFPFGIILLLGGGMAGAYGAEKSGLADVLAGFLNDLVYNLDDILALLVIIIFMVFVTEVMSNTACVSLMMPILKSLAEQRGSNPLLFMFPTTLAASFAFMFPVATPPNAIIFQTGKFRIIDMVMAGFVVNLIGIGVIFFASTTYGAAYFHLFDMPWNATTLSNGTTVYTCLYY